MWQSFANGWIDVNWSLREFVVPCNQNNKKMSIVISRIKNFLDKTFTNKIDMSDLSSRPKNDQEKNFYSRALCSYALLITAGSDIEGAANAITDGFDDNGIDAIYFDKNSKNFWIVQSKFIESGQGGIDTGDIEKFTKGIKRLVNKEYSKFNEKINNRRDEIEEALDDASVKFQLLLAYTGKQLSTHNHDSINDLLISLNDTEEIVFFTDFNIERAYKGLEYGVGSAPINEDILVSNWGHIEDPFKSYYGQVTGESLADLWQKHGKRLFTENIRTFLGTSPVNQEIIKTIKSEPENFVYFNNGITILCNSIKKRASNDRITGVFSCTGLSVVNGAQTLGSIGSLVESNPSELEKVKVIVKFISLEDSPTDFAHQITVATNTQNKVEKKDFVSLDTEQARIKLELKLENIDYHYKRGNETVVANESNYLLDEVAFSLASLWDNVDYSTMVKKESGEIWKDVTAPPYTDLFNNATSATKIIKAIKIYRFVTNKMNELSNSSEGKKKSIYRYGNSFITHIVCQKISKNLWSDLDKNFEDFLKNDLNQLVDEHITKLINLIETHYPESMIVFVMRNYTKCRHLKSLII